jgi:hypothetical protein
MKNKNWSLEEETKLAKLYVTDGITDPFELAAEFEGKNHRSIISKLVQLKIYNKPEKEPLKTHNTVKSLIKRLETALDITVEGFNLTKKENLIMVVEAIEEKCGITNPSSLE